MPSTCSGRASRRRSSAVLSFASVFIVARLVGPAEVGIGAAAVAVHVLLWVAVNALFADALVQRSVVDDAAFSSAFAASAAIGCVAALLQVALGLPLAWSLGDGRLTTMSAVLALSLPLVGAAGPVQGMLTRDRAYRKLAWRTLTGQGLGTLVGVVSALAGAGAWALVAQQLVISAGGAHRAAAAQSDAAAPHGEPGNPARVAAHRPAAHRQHAGAARPLSSVRAADRRHRRRGGTRPGAHGVPPGRCGARTRLHRAVAADAAAAVGAAA